MMFTLRAFTNITVGRTDKTQIKIRGKKERRELVHYLTQVILDDLMEKQETLSPNGYTEILLNK